MADLEARTKNDIPEFFQGVTHVLWDFNGTLLGDVEVCFKSINFQLDHYGLPQIPDIQQYRKNYGFPIKRYYESLGFDFTKISYEIMAEEWIEKYIEYSNIATLRKGVVQSLEYFASKGIQQAVLSASEINVLTKQLKDLGIYDYFDDVLGRQDVYASSKSSIGVAWMKEKKPAKAFLIGDTLHDLETAQAMGIGCVLLAGGHGDKEKLLETGLYVYDELTDMLNDLS